MTDEGYFQRNAQGFLDSVAAKAWVREHAEVMDTLSAHEESFIAGIKHERNQTERLLEALRLISYGIYAPATFAKETLAKHSRGEL